MVGGACEHVGGMRAVSSLCFFFSSRRRHTRCLSDWSSDVCSSDLESAAHAPHMAPDQALVNLNRMLATDTVTLWPDHAGTELMEDLEGCFVARKPELALKLKGRLPRRLGCHEITRPKPD